MSHETLDIITHLVIIIAFASGIAVGLWVNNIRWRRKLPSIRREATKKSKEIIGGKFAENLAPFLPGFPYRPTDCRFLGNPIDFVVFKHGESSEVIFIEVKSGKSKLSTPERKLRDTIKAGNVRWEEYRVPPDLTK